jgi:hypothetical protein
MPGSVAGAALLVPDDALFGGGSVFEAPGRTAGEVVSVTFVPGAPSNPPMLLSVNAKEDLHEASPARAHLGRIAGGAATTAIRPSPQGPKRLFRQAPRAPAAPCLPLAPAACRMVVSPACEPLRAWSGRRQTQRGRADGVRSDPDERSPRAVIRSAATAQRPRCWRDGRVVEGGGLENR